jgi:hypothetical protein
VLLIVAIMNYMKIYSAWLLHPGAEMNFPRLLHHIMPNFIIGFLFKHHNAEMKEAIELNISLANS